MKYFEHIGTRRKYEMHEFVKTNLLEKFFDKNKWEKKREVNLSKVEREICFWKKKKMNDFLRHKRFYS